jgi:hypothetical protein
MLSQSHRRTKDRVTSNTVWVDRPVSGYVTASKGTGRVIRRGLSWAEFV